MEKDLLLKVYLFRAIIDRKQARILLLHPVKFFIDQSNSKIFLQFEQISSIKFNICLTKPNNSNIKKTNKTFNDHTITRLTNNSLNNCFIDRMLFLPEIPHQSKHNEKQHIDID